MPEHFIFNVSSEIPLEFQIAQPIYGFTNYLFRTDTSRKIRMKKLENASRYFQSAKILLSLQMI